MSQKPSIPNSLNEHWMPFTSNKDFKERPRLITEAKGVYLKNHEGNTQIDASSGLFCNPLGHGRQEIIDAISNQLKTLDYAQPFQQGFGGSFFIQFVDQLQLKQQSKSQLLIIKQEVKDIDLDLWEEKELTTE